MRPAPLNEPKQHVVSTPGVCGGKPCIAGTRIRVWDIAVRAQRGESLDEILESFSELTLADLHAALAHFYDNRDQIELAAVEDDRMTEDLHQKHGPGPLEEKLSALAPNPKPPSGT